MLILCDVRDRTHTLRIIGTQANLGDALGMLGAPADVGGWDLVPVPEFDASKYKSRSKALRRSLDAGSDRAKKALAKMRKEGHFDAAPGLRAVQGGTAPFGKALGILIRCHYWGYGREGEADLASVGKNALHRKVKGVFKKKTTGEDPLLVVSTTRFLAAWYA